MADFNIAITKTIAKEGGAKFTETAGDRGGKTKFGISQLSYPSLDIANLTEERAKEIYRADYWNRIRGDEIDDQSVAENIFDFAVNAGVRTAVRLAQVVLGVEADGVSGPKTVRALNSCNPDHFFASYTLAKIARYASICNKDKAQSKFLLGWVNRALGGA